MRILGIETSCDETAAAVLEVNRGRFSLLSNVVASQVKLHAKTGGVVPEVAARAHAEAIFPVIGEALREGLGFRGQVSGVRKSKPPPATQASLLALRAGQIYNLKPAIDAIAVTAGPGLITSLLVGVEAARTLSYAWGKPLVAVNHLDGHIYANFLTRKKIGEFQISNFKFPILCLIVSGGHTELVLVKSPLDHTVIGSTRDDAAGECFDKVAKMLGLGYPGGPAIAAHAAKCKVQSAKCKVNLPRPMIDSPDFDFSFAGLKTAALYWLRAKSLGQKVSKFYALSPRLLAEFCHELQEAIVEVLVAKTIRAAKAYHVKTVMLGGGVSANQRLRFRLGAEIKKRLPTTHYSLPAINYTGDNAAMIAAAGYFYAQKKMFTPWEKIDADPNMAL